MKIKKYLSIFIIVIFLSIRVVPFAVIAQEVPSPTPDSTTIQNNSIVDNGVNSNADTGNNAINPTPAPDPTADPTIVDSSPTPTPTPTPTPDISPDPSPTPDPAVGITSSTDVSNSSTSTADTGNNSIIATDSANLSATPSPLENSSSQSGNNNSSNNNSSAIQTGDAVSVANVENNINTTQINSKITNQTINLFVTRNGNLDLFDPFTIASDVISAHLDDPVINVSVTNVNNYSYLSNDINAFANTGTNTINGGQSAIIDTGNAYSIVSLLNQVNFTVINSTIHIVTINIFGDLNGNIVLPDSQNQSSNCSGCQGGLTINNQADVNNNINSSAVSGQNTITTASDSAQITTGDAKSSISNLNIVNTNLVGVNAQALYINNFGNWYGNFIGWNDFGPQLGGVSMLFSQIGASEGIGNNCPSCNGSLNIANNATVSNNISSTANTGGNGITAGNGEITTGKAFSTVSLINFVNTSFINSIGYFGFINIFGNFWGDIGGKSQFDAKDTENPTPTPQDQQITVTTNNDSPNSSPVQKEDGGQLSATTSNNVGEYVLPGDTVTFFANIKNPGTGKVYGTTLNLSLIKDGKNVGGAKFNLGDIGAAKSVKLTTGLVLSKSTPPGTYIARVTVSGTTGENNQDVSASAESTFDVFGASVLAASIIENNTDQINPPAVLGSIYKNDRKTQDPDRRMIYLLISTVTAFFTIRIIRRRDILITLFNRSEPLRSRLRTLQMFLL